MDARNERMTKGERTDNSIPPDQIEAVKASHPLADVVPKYTKRDKRTRKWLCPIHNEKSGSFNITPDGGGFICYGCGAKGDVIEFIRRVEGLSFVDAFEHLNDGREATVPTTNGAARRAKVDADAERNRETARRIFRESKPLEGSLVETYLRTRAIEPPYPESLRFHSNLHYFDQDGSGALFLPAMVGGIQWPDRSVNAILRTYIDPRGDRKAQVSNERKTLGSFNGGALRLGPAGIEIGIAEGCETGLSAMRLFEVSVWCACGTRLDGIDLPPEVKTVHVFADNGVPGHEAAERAADRYTHEGRRVEIRYPPLAFGDWNDVIQKRQSA